MKYKVKLSYGPDFIFDNIEEASVFFDQALRHTAETLKWASIEPIYQDPDDAEEVSDD